MTSERGMDMKKLLAILVVLGMLLLPGAMAEETTGDAAALTGDWYTIINGTCIRLNFAEDGTYTLAAAGRDPVAGTWEAQDGSICLDGVRPPEITAAGDLLEWTGQGVYFSREPVESYTPADLLAELPKGILNGYWVCAYADRNGAAVPAADGTDLYVEGQTVILGGPELGDTMVRLNTETGALAGDTESGYVRIGMQQDDMLRLTITGPDGVTQIRYMIRAISPVVNDPYIEE